MALYILNCHQDNIPDFVFFNKCNKSQIEIQLFNGASPMKLHQGDWLVTKLFTRSLNIQSLNGAL